MAIELRYIVTHVPRSVRRDIEAFSNNGHNVQVLMNRKLTKKEMQLLLHNGHFANVSRTWADGKSYFNCHKYNKSGCDRDYVDKRLIEEESETQHDQR